MRASSIRCLCRYLCLTLALIGASLAVAEPVPDASACGAGGHWLSFAGERLQTAAPGAVIAEAAAKDVVLLGEQHDLEDHRRWQLQVLAALHAQRPELVIGFEMFPRRVQPVLDRWVDGQLSAQDFLAQVEWEKVWNFPPQIYLPLFEFARINRIPLLALNVDQKLTRAIAEKGWNGIPPAEREGVGLAAEPAAAYRELLRGVHREHVAARTRTPGGAAGDAPPSFENFLDSQLAWDRAMAEALAKRAVAGEHAERPLLVGVMGSGHIRFGHGVPHQLRDLGVWRVANLLPITGSDECQGLQPGVADAVFLLPENPAPAAEPPRLGISLEDDARGLRIAQVMAGSLAEKSGLRADDLIVEIAGRPGVSSIEARAAIRRQPPGTWLPLKLERDGSALEIDVRFPVMP